jgi:hypothetical protein
MLKRKRRVMTSNELRVFSFYNDLQELDLFTDAPAFFDVHKKTVQRWLRGEVPIPDPVVMLLSLMIKTGTGPRTVRKLIPHKRVN